LLYSTARSHGAEPELVARCKGGRRVPVEMTCSPLETPEGVVSFSILRDISERRTSESRRAARYAVRRILSDSASLDAAAAGLLQTIWEALRHGVAVLGACAPRANALLFARLWHGPAVIGTALQSACADTSFARGSGLPGQVWAQGRPVANAVGCED